MNVAYTIWTWGLSKKEDFENGVREAKEAGYDYIEHFASLADMYFDCNDEFQTLLEKYDMKLINLYYNIGGMQMDNIAKAEKVLKFLQRNGVKYMNIQAPKRPEYGPTAKDLDDLSNILNAIGKLARDYGIWLCVHPHMETTLEQEHEIEYTANRINPEYVAFCFDTAHTTLAGMDCVRIFEKYSNLIRFVHLKDAFKGTDVVEIRKNWRDPEIFKSSKIFYELGQADIDFKGVMNVLKNIGYEGYLTVELDHTRYTNKESAIISREYLKNTLGL